MSTASDADPDELELALLELNPNWKPLDPAAKAAILASVASAPAMTEAEARHLGRLLRRVLRAPL
jgi:hypothetical protein